MEKNIDSRTSTQAEYLYNRLRKNERVLRSWIRSADAGAVRLYDRDIPEIPLAVDRYKGQAYASDEPESALVLALYERPYEKSMEEEAAWLDRMASSACDALGIPRSRVFLKTRRRMEGLSQYGTDSSSFLMKVRESGLFFKIELSRFLDTGLFSDHRPARSLVRALAAGSRALNLFSYTGAFSVYAAAGGAASVTSVDLSNTYLGWSEDNFKLNSLDENLHEPVRSDVLQFLYASRRSGRRWDLIIADPPTFSNSTMAPEDFDINKDWPELLGACRDALSPHGIILFSTNSRRLRWEPSLSPLPWKDISEWSIPPDFRNSKIHRCWLLGDTERAEIQLAALRQN